MYKAQTEKGKELEDRGKVAELFINPWGLLILLIILIEIIFR